MLFYACTYLAQDLMVFLMPTSSKEGACSDCQVFRPYLVGKYSAHRFTDNSCRV